MKSKKNEAFFNRSGDAIGSVFVGQVTKNLSSLPGAEEPSIVLDFGTLFSLSSQCTDDHIISHSMYQLSIINIVIFYLNDKK